MRLIGVAQHSPTFIKGLVTEAFEIRKKKPKIFVLPVAGTVRTKKASTADAVFIVRYKDFLNNLSTLNSNKFRGKPVFLFASVLRMNEIKPIHVLDNHRINDCTFSLEKTNRLAVSAAMFDKAEDVRVARPTEDFLAQLIKDSKEGSLLSPLMTLIYMLPSTSQNTVKLKIFEWLITDKPVKALQASLANVRRLPDDVAAKLYDLLTSEIAQEYRRALEYVVGRRDAKKPVSYKAVLKEFKVTRYEIKYIMHVLKLEPKATAEKGKTLNEMYYSRPRNKSDKIVEDADD